MSEPRLARIKRLTGYADKHFVLHNPENPQNKYNRTLGRAFIDRRFNVFAVIGGIGIQTK
jgi:hypothetical protein